MVELLAFVDAGGTTDPAPVYSLGCALFIAERWTDFDLDWQAAMAEFDLHKPFHMTDYHSCRDQFSSWRGRADRESNLQRLLNVAAKSIVLTAGHAVARSVYQRDVPGDVDAYVGGGPYGFLFMQLAITVDEMLQSMAKFGEMETQISIRYLVEAGDRDSRKIVDAFNARRATDPFLDRIASVDFARKSDSTGLELADIVAWSTHRNIASDFGLGAIDETNVVETLFRRPHRWAYYKQDGLQLRHDVNTIQQLLGQAKIEFLT